MLERTDEVTGYYIDQHARHFSHHFSQTVSFWLIYAVANAALLGLGGWLVIQGQLSLGQLVAAELVMSAVFAGVTQLGTYMSYFYDVCGAVDELSLFFKVKQEMPSKAQQRLDCDSSLTFYRVLANANGKPINLDFRIPAGARVCTYADGHAAQRLFTNLVRGHETPDTGYIAIGGTDLRELRSYEVRREIIVLDRPYAVESTIREYLRLSTDEPERLDLMQILDMVGLADTVAQLPDGLDTRLAGSGWPLTITETLQVKLASAIIAQPRVLVLSQAYDAMPEDCLLRAMDILQSQNQTTVIYFTYENADLDFNLYLHLGHDSQSIEEQLCRPV